MSAKFLNLEGFAGLKKIGFITPSSNTSLEPITNLISSQLCEEITTHYSRVEVRTITLEEKDVSQFNLDKMLDAAALLADANVDAILWNGTSGAWSGRGFEADRLLSKEITKVHKIPASTSSLAQLNVLDYYGIKRFGLATPYVKEPAKQMVATYGQAGYEIVKEAHLGIDDNQVIGAAKCVTVKNLARNADSPNAECIVVRCTNLATISRIEEMEYELAKPIYDSISVTLWKALKMLKISTPFKGWGHLLRAQP